MILALTQIILQCGIWRKLRQLYWRVIYHVIGRCVDTEGVLHWNPGDEGCVLGSGTSDKSFIRRGLEAGESVYGGSWKTSVLWNVMGRQRSVRPESQLRLVCAWSCSSCSGVGLYVKRQTYKQTKTEKPWVIERNWEFRPYSGCRGWEERGSVKGAAADLLWAQSCGEESVRPPSLLGERIRSPGRAIRWEVGGWSSVFKFAAPCLRRRFMKWEHRRKGSTSGLVETI